MKHILILAVSIFFTVAGYARDIHIEKMVTDKSINCENNNPMLNMLNDIDQQVHKNAGIQVNASKATVQLGTNRYLGINGYKFYKTKDAEQHDFAVNFKSYGVRIIKIAFQGLRTDDGESGIYYYIFEGDPATVTYHLRKAMGNRWNVENTLEETAQGNSKLVCVYAG